MKPFDQPTLNVIHAALRLFQKTPHPDIPISILDIADGSENLVDIDALCEQINFGSAYFTDAFLAGVGLKILPAWCNKDAAFISAYLQGLEAVIGAWEPDLLDPHDLLSPGQACRVLTKARSLVTHAQKIYESRKQVPGKRLLLKHYGSSANGDLVVAVFDAYGVIMGSQFEIGPRPALNTWSVFERDTKTGHAHILWDVPNVETALRLCAERYNAVIRLDGCYSTIELAY